MSESRDRKPVESHALILRKRRDETITLVGDHFPAEHGFTPRVLARMAEEGYLEATVTMSLANGTATYRLTGSKLADPENPDSGIAELTFELVDAEVIPADDPAPPAPDSEDPSNG